MIVVIQCAGTKRKHAGHLQTRDGKSVLFVADPAAAHGSDTFIYARPDDPSDQVTSWRDYLIQYNETPWNNPFGLLPAYELYEREIYRTLANRIGINKTFILSAGWGMIPAPFLTPSYDITFSPRADLSKRRKKHETWADLSMLPADTNEPIVFLGGKDYLPLFLRLTAHVSSLRTIFYNSLNAPDAPDCRLVRFETKTKTNWHYECASKLLSGQVGP
jgi:hypothetical protein